MNRFIFGLAVSLAVIMGTGLGSNSAKSASTVTIYNNFSAGYYCCQGYTINGSSAYGSSAPLGDASTFSDNFTALETASISQIVIALQHVSGANSAVVSLWTAGFGTELWNETLYNLPRFGYGYPGPFNAGSNGSAGLTTITGISGVNVTAGVSYILQVAPVSLTSTSYLVWNCNSDITGGALEITGVATPLPATWTMLIVGFVGFGFLARRAKRRAGFDFV